MPTTLQQWQDFCIRLARTEAGDDGAHDLNHLGRVWRTARQLLDSYPQVNPLIVMCACYLHDLVNLPKNHPERHLASRQAATLASQHLATAGFPAELLDDVAHAIEAHSFSANITPRTLAAQIVQDADRLDALGAVGLARLFYTAGRMNSALAATDDVLGEHRPLDDRAYALDHIKVKLATLPASMQTEAGRTLGEERLKWLYDFREVFAAEWGESTGQHRLP